jgi:hypothetical protein
MGAATREVNNQVLDQRAFPKRAYLSDPQKGQKGLAIRYFLEICLLC